MPRIAALIIIMLWTQGAWASEAMKAYCPRPGFCDFSTQDWKDDPTLAIDTEWNFYWKKLLTPEDIAQGQGGSPESMRFHQRWNTQDESPDREAHSYATYQLHLKLVPNQIYSLRFPDISSASRIWINGTLVRESGQVATQEKDEVPFIRPFIHSFVADEITTITLQLSNFSSYFNGARGSFVLGLPAGVSSLQAHDVMLDALIIGCIVIMAFYHIYLWYLRPHRFTPLYYAIFCLAIGMRSMIVGSGKLLTYVAPQLPFEYQYKIEYTTMGFAGISLLMVIYTLYHREFPKKLCATLVAISSVMTLFIFFASARTYPRFLPVIQLDIFVSCVLGIYGVFRAFLNKREGAGLFLAGFGIFFLAVLNDILFSNRLLNTFVMTHMGMFGFILCQAMILSFRFDMAFDRAEAAERESRRLNESLEIKVADRTREIQKILLHVKSGFLALDRDGLILPGFTRSCSDLLNGDIQPGDSFVAIMSEDRSTQSHFRMALAQVFEESLPIEVSLEQLQCRVSIRGKVLSLSGSEIRDEGTGRITAILLTIHDATSLQLAEQKVGYNEMLIKILQNKESFQMFLQDFWNDIRDARVACDHADQPRLRMLLHTMKGNLSAFGIQDAVNLIHGLENKETIQPSDIADIEICLKNVEAACSDLVGLEGAQQKQYALDQAEFESLKRHIEGLGADPARSRLLELVDHIPLNTARSYLGPIQQNMAQIASFLGKSIALEITGGELKVDPRYANVLRNLIHLIRNAADHGIETPADRGDKDPLGHIRLSFQNADHEFIIRIEDDGRGLDYERIRQKALNLGLKGSSSPISEQDLAQLIFHPSFTTANEVTELSGRGVGLAAVKEAVDKIGGRIETRSQARQGCLFVITLPDLRSRLSAA